MAINLPTDPKTAQKRKQLPSHGVLLILLLIFAAVKLVVAITLPRTQALASDLTIESILAAVNSQRSQRSLVTLNTDTRLSSAAQSKADDMQARHYFAHVDPDGNYIWPKIVAAGYTPYLELGENLAIEFYDTDSLVNAWMNSPTHRANILNDGFRDQGMGLDFGDANAGQYHSVVANTFGTLLVKKVQAAPAAPATTPKPTQPAVSGLSMPPLDQTPAPATPKPRPQTPPASSSPPPQTQPTPTTTVPQNNPPTEVINNPATPRGDFALAQSPGPLQPSTTPPESKPSTSKLPGTIPARQTTAPAVVNNQAGSPLQNYQTNRYITLAFGIVFFLFLLTDLRGVMLKKTELIGKKINNLMLLFLALVVIAVMYWL